MWRHNTITLECTQFSPGAKVREDTMHSIYSAETVVLKHEVISEKVRINLLQRKLLQYTFHASTTIIDFTLKYSFVQCKPVLPLPGAIMVPT